MDGEPITFLKPCPFCGGEETTIDESRLSPRMDGKLPALISVEVKHWCRKPDGVVAALIRFTGREKAEAVDMWNTRI